jgi:aspartyl-tRNA(Asn)/glutamyl-tRNA(Gln) amidotransferase subunit B
MTDANVATAAGHLADGWEMVIGLEVHCELRTETKLFCSCRNAFGDEPNTNICPVCLGLPGSLPVLNERAVEYAMRIGEALHCTIQPSIFHRKNYFYPDMPKDYQVSQYDEPINVEGWLELPDGKRIGIVRAHMEEDTGKSTHVGGTGRIGGADYSLVDYNRSGVPLVEIVSEPDMRSSEEAKAYVAELRSILVAIGASDGKMEEGSLRVDANVSVRPKASATFGTRCEIKNLNSLRSLGRAIEYEARRQVDILENGDTVRQETRHWDEAEGRTSTMRSKEEAYDYRYFPEPDLVPVDPSDELRATVKAAIPVLPAERRRNLAEVLGETPGEVALLVELELDGLVTAAVEAGGDPRIVRNLAANELAARLGEKWTLGPASFAKLSRLQADGKLSATQAKQVLNDLLDAEEELDPEDAAKARGYEAMDTASLEGIVDELIANNPDAFEKFKAGDGKITGFFVGQVMKATQGKADGKVVTQILNNRAGA